MSSSIQPFAWFFMLFSMGAVTLLAGYCFYRILTGEDRGSFGDGPEAGGEG
ncbi:MAG: hypothetical protein ACE5HQ_10390 [Gemmatimonadota bacterium]